MKKKDLLYLLKKVDNDEEIYLNIFKGKKCLECSYILGGKAEIIGMSHSENAFSLNINLEEENMEETKATLTTTAEFGLSLQEMIAKIIHCDLEESDKIQIIIRLCGTDNSSITYIPYTCPNNPNEPISVYCANAAKTSARSS